MAKYFLRFPTLQHKGEFLSELAAPEVSQVFSAQEEEKLVISELTAEEATRHALAGVKVYKDIVFKPTNGDPGPPAAPPNATLAQVVQQVRAPNAWNLTRGEGVTVAILDTGIADAAEFKQKHSPLSFSLIPQSNPWDSPDAHGAMCASIAAGTNAAGGRYNGVAPAASILSVRLASYAASDVYPAYQKLIQLKSSGALLGPVILNNSFAIDSCTPPSDPLDHPFFQIIRDAAAVGIASVFAAGNWHSTGLCGWPPTQCTPNTIWSANSLDEVLCVGAVDWNNSNQTMPHGDSSRGPGQFATLPGKPDCVSPTYGEVLRLNGYETRAWWGTSGAAPVVTGLLALLYSRALQLGRNLTVPDAFNIVRKTCHPLPAASTCVGSGLVDCLAAVSALDQPQPVIPPVTLTRTPTRPAARSPRASRA